MEDIEVDKNAPKSNEKMFSLKKWNAVAMWSWDVECDTCAICRVQVMGESASFISDLCTLKLINQNKY